MGFKAIEKHYDIKHIICVRSTRKYKEPCIFIGSAFIDDIIVIRIRDAKVIKHYYESGYGENENLLRYEAALSADEKNGVLQKLIDQQDVFEKDLPVFTIKNGYVAKALCEEYGWPNTTHAGKVMYCKMYFKTRKEAYRFLLKDTNLAIKIGQNFGDTLYELYHKLKNLKLCCVAWFLARTVGRFTTKKENIWD